MSGSLSVFTAAAERPSAIALVVDGEAITWAALADEAARACIWLTGSDVALRHCMRSDVASQHCTPPAPAAIVSMIAAPTREAIVLAHTCIALGVPIAPLHPRWTEIERRAHERSAGVWARLDPSGAPWRSLASTSASPSHHQPVLDDTRPLAVLATSGSSGAPRAVELSRAAFFAAARASAANLGARDEDRWLLALPWAHVGGLSILVRALAGRVAVVVDPRRGSFDPRAFIDTIARDRVTLASLVPAQLARLVEETDMPAPTHLRAILVGGAATPGALLGAARRRGWPVLATYGLTETCAQVATHPLDEACDPAAAERGDCGPPLEGVRVCIVDGPGGAPVPIGSDGRIAVRGPTLLTRVRSGEAPTDSFAADDGWLVTGDLGRLDERGRLHVLGRADEVIVSGGENIAPVEVEAALASHPAVAAACVFAIPDSAWGQLVAAAIVARTPVDAATFADLRRHLDARLAAFKRPRRLALVEALALGPTGKVDRRAVAAACASANRLMQW